MERAKHGTVFISLFFAVLGVVPFFIGSNYTPPSTIIQILLVVFALLLFLVSFFWPDLTGKVVKMKLGSPCKITDQNTQLYLFRKDLPFVTIVKVANKEIIFVSVTQELIREQEWEIIRHAILKKNITVKIYILIKSSCLGLNSKIE